MSARHVNGRDHTVDADNSLLARGHVTRQVAVMLLMVGSWHQDVDVLPDHLIGLIAELAHRSRIE